MLHTQQLAALLGSIEHPESWRLKQSPSWSIDSWEDLETQRNQARQHNAEGLMIKQAESPYLSGRKRGNWWKHKLEPMTLDAVLLYAQAGSGRRANLFTDYTFGLWTNDEEPQLGPSPRPIPASTMPKSSSWTAGSDATPCSASGRHGP